MSKHYDLQIRVQDFEYFPSLGKRIYNQNRSITISNDFKPRFMIGLFCFSNVMNLVDKIHGIALVLIIKNASKAGLKGPDQTLLLIIPKLVQA